jgi:hypothetical protein
MAEMSIKYVQLACVLHQYNRPLKGTRKEPEVFPSSFRETLCGYFLILRQLAGAKRRLSDSLFDYIPVMFIIDLAAAVTTF